MALGICRIHHVQVSSPPELEAACIRFYEDVLGLERVAKPAGSQVRGGAWFQHGEIQIHLSREAISAAENRSAKRHVCYLVRDLGAAERWLRGAEVEIVADDNPTPGWPRFYIRDPRAIDSRSPRQTPPAKAQSQPAPLRPDDPRLQTLWSRWDGNARGTFVAEPPAARLGSAST